MFRTTLEALEPSNNKQFNMFIFKNGVHFSCFPLIYLITWGSGILDLDWAVKTFYRLFHRTHTPDR